MFIIIGGDGKEYGPVSVEQIRAWLAGGRANLETKAKAVGTDEWRRLGDFAEFSGTGPAAPPPMVTGEIDPKIFADDLIARAAPLDIGGCISRSWELLKSDFWAIVGVTLVVIVVGLVARFIPFIGWLVGLLFSGVLYGGLYFYFLKKVRGQPAELGDAFSGFSVAFGPLVLTSILVILLTMVGFVCLILPGIYLAIAYSFAYLLVIDRKMEFWVAMEVSRRVITASGGGCLAWSSSAPSSRRSACSGWASASSSPCRSSSAHSSTPTRASAIRRLGPERGRII